MKNPKLYLILFRILGLCLFLAFAYWGVDSIKNDGLSYWVRYIARIIWILLAVYGFIIVCVLVYKAIHHWRYPDFHRELSQIEISFIDGQTNELSAYVQARNFGSKKYWITAWIFILCFLVSCGIILTGFVSISENWPTIPDHERFGPLFIQNSETVFLVPIVVFGISSGVLLATCFSALMGRTYRPLSEAFTIGISLEEKSLGEKAENFPEVIAKYVRNRKLDTSRFHDGQQILSFIRDQRIFSLLKWGISLGLIAIGLNYLSMHFGTKFYETGLVKRSILNFSKQELIYSEIDHIGISCLYNNEERETKKQHFHFFKNGKELGEIRFPAAFDKDFDRFNDHLLSLSVKFLPYIFTFEQKSKNVKNSFSHCAKKLMEENPGHESWIRHIMHLDQSQKDLE